MAERTLLAFPVGARPEWVQTFALSRLYNPVVSTRQMALFFAAALVLLAIVIATTRPLNDLVDLIWLKLKIVLGID